MMPEWRVEKVLEDHGHGRVEQVRDTRTGLTYVRIVGLGTRRWQVLGEVPGFPPMLYVEADGTDSAAIVRPATGLSLLEVCGRIRIVEGLGPGVLLPVPVTVVVVRAVVRSLMALHRRRYVYRGLHPRWVVVDPATESVFLTRPGCAVPVGDSEGDLPDATGCLHELTPPEWKSGAHTPAWDAFAVGGLLLFCVTGQYPQRMDTAGRPVFVPREITALVDAAVERLRTAGAPELGPVLEETLREDPQGRPSLPVLHERLAGFLIRHRISEASVWLALGRLAPTSDVPPVTYVRAWQYVRHEWPIPPAPTAEAASPVPPEADPGPTRRRRLRGLFSK
jgi:hypothetical protein